MPAEKTEVINRTEKASSFEFGKASERFKIYFEGKEDLDAMLDVCKAALEKKKKLFDEAVE